MTIQDAISKAIEGGWNKEWGVMDFEFTRSYPSRIDFFVGKKLVMAHSPFYLLLDPSFWQALKETMEWPDFSTEYGVKMEGWRCRWHRLIDHLAEGKDINSYFETL